MSFFLMKEKEEFGGKQRKEMKINNSCPRCKMEHTVNPSKVTKCLDKARQVIQSPLMGELDASFRIQSFFNLDGHSCWD